MYTACHDDCATVETVFGQEVVMKWAVVVEWSKGCGPDTLDSASVSIECDGAPACSGDGVSMKHHIWWVKTYRTDEKGKRGYTGWGRQFACDVVAEVGGLDPKRFYLTFVVDIYDDGTSKYTRK
jgi:hypothetical protein